MVVDRKFEYLSAQGLLLAFILWMTAYKRVRVTKRENNDIVSWDNVLELVNEFLGSVNDAGERFF